jgi:PleD family two-component response regulator
MRLIHRKQTEAQDQLSEAMPDDVVIEEPAPEPGPELLKDGVLLARWFILYELDKELRRAARHERPLSIVVLMPTPTLGRDVSEESLARAAEAAQKAARSTDLIGWLPKNGILIVMPETDKDGAASAVHRWRDAMYTSTMRAGAVRWRVATSVNAWEFESAEQLLESLTAQLDTAKAA